VTRGDTERGGIVVELLLLAPVVMLAVMFVAWAGRGPSAAAETVRIANTAAQIAANQETPGEAQAAVQALDTSSVICTSLSVVLDTSRWNEGWVSVDATCVPNTTGVTALGVGDPIEQRSVAQVQQWGNRG